MLYTQNLSWGGDLSFWRFQRLAGMNMFVYQKPFLLHIHKLHVKISENEYSHIRIKQYQSKKLLYTLYLSNDTIEFTLLITGSLLYSKVLVNFLSSEEPLYMLYGVVHLSRNVVFFGVSDFSVLNITVVWFLLKDITKKTEI